MTSINAEEKIKILMKLKMFAKKIQRGFASAPKSDNEEEDDEEEEEEEEQGTRNKGEKMVPGDVKKGHFAVIAGTGVEAKKFILEIDYLSDPAFVKLLEQAEDEYGHHQQGVLAVPCRPQELQTIIGDCRRSRRRSTEW